MEQEINLKQILKKHVPTFFIAIWYDLILDAMKEAAETAIEIASEAGTIVPYEEGLIVDRQSILKVKEHIVL